MNHLNQTTKDKAMFTITTNKPQTKYIVYNVKGDNLGQFTSLIERDEKTGLHYIVEKSTGVRCYDKLAGWLKHASKGE